MYVYDNHCSLFGGLKKTAMIWAGRLLDLHAIRTPLHPMSNLRTVANKFHLYQIFTYNFKKITIFIFFSNYFKQFDLNLIYPCLSGEYFKDDWFWRQFISYPFKIPHKLLFNKICVKNLVQYYNKIISNNLVLESFWLFSVSQWPKKL